MIPLALQPNRQAPRWLSARGQALIETMLLTWIMIVFIAAAYQLFVVNRQITASLTQVHAKMFRGAFYHNCADDEERCTNDRGELKSAVIWNTTNVPQVRVPRVNMFRPGGILGMAGLRADMQIASNSPRNGTPDPYCDPQDPACKRTRAAAGTFQSIWDIFTDLEDTVSNDATYNYLAESIDDLLFYELRGFIEDFTDSLDQMFWFVPEEWREWVYGAFGDLLSDLPS